ncbi:MAG: CDGSH iron-sulfur domain-containing protein [Sandaracinus sp.]|nr:CDGSH iron-sulfur domain-containing protein [Sandaracinus sp.]MCB9619229.1 CDGSH iron-sulfur domain-containing protein [Sandaracinus sp.]
MSDDVQRYEGKTLTVLFDGARCIHARQCVLGLPEVFRANVEGPWIDPDGAEPDEVRALARRCPSGAIRVEPKDGVSAERPPKKNAVAVVENGPLAVRADLRIVGQEPRIRATLCRCGASAKKPFCDGSHETMGFAATGEPPAANELATLDETGPLTVKLAKNGPLLLEGPAEVVRGGTGKPIRRAMKMALCRCGGSKNKPFCDGTHASIGFEAE